MIWFYRDFLDGFVYIIFALLSLIFIMAIIGFILERLQLEKEEKNRIAVLNANPTGVPASESAPVTPVSDLASQANVVSTTEEVVEKNDNAATNDDIPAVLDLNVIEENDKSS